MTTTVSRSRRAPAWVTRALLAAGACLALLGCGPARSLPADQTAPVRIGTIVPLSGELGADGASWRDAVRLAVREVNAAGGVLPGRPVELLIQDGQSTREQGVVAARALVDQGAVAIVGDAASSATIDVYQMVTGPARVLLGSGLSTSTLLTDINAAIDPMERFFFRTVPPDEGQAPALADAMYGEGCRAVTVLYADNDYGRPFQVGTSARFRELGGVLSPANGVPYVEGGSSYRDQVTQIAALDPAPGCIALIAYPQSAGQILRDWDLLTTRPEVLWFGTDGVRQAGFATEVGDAALIDGFLGTAPLTDAPTPAYNRFASQFRATFGATPSAFSSNVYDAAALILLAIAKAGSDEDPYAIRDALGELNRPGGTVVQAGRLAEGLRLIRENRPIDYEGASGSVALDANGDIEGIYELWRFDASGATSGTFSRVRILE
jgi:ABC-type branched-subunit amino acid transport system substrate-binding protein